MPQFFAVRDIASGRGLPVLDPADRRPDSPLQEAGQPPLYHLLASRLFFGLNTDDILRLTPNPHALIGIPTTDPWNKNRVVHPDHEGRLQGVQAVQRARLLSIALGLIAVLATCWLALTLAPREPGLAILAGALVAFNPMFLFVSASVANDSAIAAFSTLVLVLLTPTLLGRPSYSVTALLGVAVGCAALTKLSGLGLLPLAAAALAWSVRRGVRLAHALRHGAVLYSLAALVAGWWYVRNVLLYGEPTGLSAWLALVGGRGQPVDWEEVKGLWVAFWGVFGPFDLLAQPWVYWTYAALCALSLAGWIALLLTRQPGLDWLRIGFLGLWVAIEALALARWTSLNLASSGRLLFPAIGAIAVLLALGLLLPVSRGLRTGAGAGGALLLLGVAASIPFQSIRPVFDHVPLATEQDLARMPSHPQVRFDDVMELAGAAVAPQTAPGQPVEVELVWRSLKATEANYSVGVHVLGREGARLGQSDFFAGGGIYPTSRWQPGQLVRDRLRVPVAATVDPPTGARVTVSAYRAEIQAPAQAIDPAGQPVFPVQIGTTEIAAGGRCPDASQDRVLGDAIALISASPRPETVHPGDALPLTLVWCALARPGLDYSVFVHLAWPEQPPVAQADGPPRGGAYPTSAWARGELVQDSRTIAIAPNTPAGAYRLLVGLYDLRTGERLRTASGADRIDLGALTVEPPRRPVFAR